MVKRSRRKEKSRSEQLSNEIVRDRVNGRKATLPLRPLSRPGVPTIPLLLAFFDIDQSHALRVAADDLDIFDAQTYDLAGVGDQHQLIILGHLLRAHDTAGLIGRFHRDDTRRREIADDTHWSRCVFRRSRPP